MDPNMQDVTADFFVGNEITGDLFIQRYLNRTEILVLGMELFYLVDKPCGAAKQMKWSWHLTVILFWQYDIQRLSNFGDRECILRHYFELKLALVFSIYENYRRRTWHIFEWVSWYVQCAPLIVALWFLVANTLRSMQNNGHFQWFSWVKTVVSWFRFNQKYPVNNKPRFLQIIFWY